MADAINIRTGKSIEGYATDSELDALADALTALIARLEGAK